ERREVRLLLSVAPVGDGVLADEVQLDHALLGESLRLLDHVLDAARALLAADAGDGAEGAAAVAALGDLHVSAGPTEREPARVARPERPLGRVTDQHAPGLAPEDGAELEHVARAEEVVDLGQLLGELGRV